ncbi:MAG: Maf family nucleotide pyrophosphatase [Lentimicrobiaceae bacterium]|jgi:septum formation protein|nr:Maf family nucleotide pyrophosphatase [Lentimicrobiaceae bacterium]
MYDFFEKISRYYIILASRSPRRQQLLHELGLHFEIMLKETEESYPSDLLPAQIALYLAELKSAAFTDTELPDNFLLITADTTVCLNGNILGKPDNFDHARQILQQLSGNKHTVITGVSLRTRNRKHSFYAESDVYFRKLSDDEICYYIEKYQPYDKAGAYGVQEWIGYTAIEKINGSFYNVMGLPVQKLYVELQSFC